MVKYERRGYGKYVVIRHENGLETVYGHLSKQIVDAKQMLKISSAAFTDTKPHYNILDGLRGVAALMVLWFHIFEAYASSHIAVSYTHLDVYKRQGPLSSIRNGLRLKNKLYPEYPGEIPGQFRP